VLTTIVRTLAQPASGLAYLLCRLPGISLKTRVALDLFDRPAYAYGILQAARQARALGIPVLSLIEFGVAKGAGLLAMERIAADVQRATGVRFRIFGFDMSEGLPRPRDYRDLPYVYRGGFYRMDQAALRPRLRRAELVLGDVRETVPPFVRTGAFPPVGFVSFDVDYYSSTVDALAIFAGASTRYLPRVFCYFDDTVHESGLYNEYTGELLAIREFNERDSPRKLCQPNGFWLTRVRPSAWNQQLYVCHLFEHPLYNAFVTPEAEHRVDSVAARRGRTPPPTLAPVSGSPDHAPIARHAVGEPAGAGR